MLLLVDLDGVLYRADQPVPGVAALLARRAAAGDTIVYVTNNSSWHRSAYEARLRGLGAPVRPDGIVTAARATALAVADGSGPVLVLGGPGLAREVRDVGRQAVGPTPRGLAAAPTVVVVGVDFRLTYRRLGIAADAVRGGARFVATNRDPVFPDAGGLSPGAGSIVAALAVAGQREPDLVVGKPGPGLFQAAARQVGLPVEAAIVIGDSLGTDIRAANRVGARSILMLTGVTTPRMAARARGDEAPTATAADATALESTLERLARG